MPLTGKPLALRIVHAPGNGRMDCRNLDIGRQLLSLYAAFATSGASLLVEEVLKRTVDPHPCQSALAAGASKPKRESLG